MSASEEGCMFLPEVRMAETEDEAAILYSLLTGVLIHLMITVISVSIQLVTESREAAEDVTEKMEKIVSLKYLRVH